MKKIVYFFIIAFSVFVSKGLYAQDDIQKKEIPLNTPKIVNFKQLSDYGRAHPVKKKLRVIEQGEDIEEKVKKKRRPFPHDAKSFKIDLAAQLSNARMAAVSTSPAPVISFNGTLDDNSVFPPDIEGAAGPVYLVETTNQEYDIFAKNGTLVATISPDLLFQATGGGGYFDPHVVYDRTNGRFLLCCGGEVANGDFAVFLAVSQTNDPTGNWYVYSFDGSGSSSLLLDFPMMGFNTNWVVITTNEFNLSSGAFVKSNIFVFNRANVYGGTSGTVTAFSDNFVYSITPAQTYDASQATEYLVADYNGDSSGVGYMQIAKITGSANTPVYNAGSIIGVNHPWDENNPGAIQKGIANILEDGDTRIGGNCVYINSSLWFSHTVFLPSGSPTHDGVDWWQVDPAGKTVTQYGRLEDPSGTVFYYYPGINVNPRGDALLGYCESSSGMYVSSSYSLHMASDLSGVMENTYIYKNGLSSYYKAGGDGRNRWGDFTGTAVDPTDSSFWNFNQWANTNNNWGTSIANVLGPCSTPVGLATINITDSSASFSWNAVPNASIYYVQYRVLNTTTWTTDSTHSTSVTINGLSATTQYEWRMPLVCTLRSSSSYTTSVVFQTLTPCSAAAFLSTPLAICSGDSAVLTATGMDTIFWYSSSVSNTVLAKGKKYTTPPLSKDTSYYAESIVTPVTQHAGPPDNTFGAGSIFTNTTTYRDLIFDCYATFKLVSVKVYAQGASTRTITLKDQAGDTIAFKTVNIPNGTSNVTLNFNVPLGTNLELGIAGNVNLYRDSTGASFPYTLSNVLSIKGTNANGLPGYYYYFYDWIIQQPSCSSPRVAVNVNVASPAAVFSYQTFGDSVVFFNNSIGATRWMWSFGDHLNDTTSKQNPTHTYTANNTYSVTLQACLGNCCNQVTNQVPVIATELSKVDADHTIRIYPNPVKNNLSVLLGNAFENTVCEFTLMDMIGRVVVKQTSMVAVKKEYTLDTSILAAGLYMLTVQNKEGKFISKTIKE